MRSLFLILAASLLSSCGSGDGDAGGTISLQEMPDRLRKAVCEKIFSCCSENELLKNPRLGKDQASCEAGLNRAAVFFLADLETSVAAGRIIYHGDRMATCLADLKAKSCNKAKMPAGEMSLTEMCSGVIESKVAAGGACTEYWDCLGGWCQGDMGDLKDRCSPIKPEGAECDEGAECASGICSDDLICASRPPGSGSICLLGTQLVGQHGAAP